MATYKEIQAYVKDNYGFTVKTCWIAHMKEICGLPVKMANNRTSPDQRVHPCPYNKQEAILAAFENFDMLEA
jgi:hypothetical protein